jgi:adenylosuccinate synthase
MVVLRNAARLSGLNGLVITKLDVLTGIDPVRIATSYVHGNGSMDSFPTECFTLENCEPSYVEFPGWNEDISNVRSFAELPFNTQKYLRAIEELSEIPLSIISVGPDRTQTIVLQDPFAD